MNSTYWIIPFTKNLENVTQSIVSEKQAQGCLDGGREGLRVRRGDELKRAESLVVAGEVHYLDCAMVSCMCVCQTHLTTHFKMCPLLYVSYTSRKLQQFKLNNK